MIKNALHIKLTVIMGEHISKFSPSFLISLSLTLGVRASTHRDGDWVLVKCHWRLKDGSGLVLPLLPVILSTSVSKRIYRISVRVLMSQTS